MTIKEQQVALAEAAGWTFNPLFNTSPTLKLSADMCWTAPGNASHETEHIPKYPTDLNEIAAARKKLINTPKLRYTYCNHLRDIISKHPDIPKNKVGQALVSDYNCINAEPFEHLEALVRTMGLYKK